MHTEAINEIKSMMGDALQPWQMERLNSVLSQVLGGTDEFQQKDKKNIVRQFIAAKRIEGCSKRTEEYYSLHWTFLKNT